MCFIRLVLILFSCLVLSACGEDAPEQPASTPVVHPPAESQAAPAPQVKTVNQSAGGVTVKILPESPTSTGCLRAVIQGVPGRSAILWKVNSEVVSTGTDNQLCSDSYKRDDTVTVEVGTNDRGAQASVSIGNSLPRVVDLSSTPAEIFAGIDISVTPVAEDADGDDVSFSYQWLINGDADPLLTEATLPGDKFTKGDSIQVLIVPNDFFEDGPTYESYAMSVPNAAPSITSEPPQGISSLDYRYQVVANDPDDNQLAYSLSDAPEGMLIDENSGLIQWSLVNVTPGDYTIAIKVSDSEGAEAVQEYRLSLGAPE
jgi:hypothetical protein